MPDLTFKDRISLYNLLGVAVLILGVFSAIYITVAVTINFDINEELKREVNVHREKSTKINGKITLVHKEEWQQSEHNTIDMNPVYIQIFNNNGESIDKSPNLGAKSLILDPSSQDEKFSDSHLNSVPIRQIQINLEEDGQKFGYTVIAMSVNPQYRILSSLIYILVITYFSSLLFLFFLTRFIAGRSIRPALSIMETTKNITANNLKARITLPANKDELYTLSQNINELLNRIENAVNREKQFTTDASHELRTPLAIIQTTLEILIRRPRSLEEYEEKINSCIEEVNRIEHTITQLMMLARFEESDSNFMLQPLNIRNTIENAIQRNKDKIESKFITIEVSCEENILVFSHESMLSIMIGNILSNAVKYSHQSGTVNILVKTDDNNIICVVSDKGIGIHSNNMDKIFDQFYRSEPGEHQHIKGTGLGLSIVKKITQLLNIQIDIESIKGKGTRIILKIPRA